MRFSPSSILQRIKAARKPDPNLMKFVVIIETIQVLSYVILWVLVTHPLFLPWNAVMFSTVLLLTLNLYFVRRVSVMTKRVTEALGTSKEINPVMRMLIERWPRALTFMPFGMILGVYGFILTMQGLFRPETIGALYIPLVMTCATGIDYANDSIMCRRRYRFLFSRP
jgi:hypothetical protein